MKRLIYADNAATTKLDIDAFEAMRPYMLEKYGDSSQPYSFSSSVKKALKKSREVIAEGICIIECKVQPYYYIKCRASCNP